ncbi:MAG TPA: calcium/proton exchanger [Anaerolineales bacterium]|nr:calcium/proton exchanger [Anaerolineales bacterium]
MQILKHVKPVHYMLLALPAVLIAELMHADPILLFGLACAGLIPLASLIGEATEALAHVTGPRIGGLLNATLGNAAELIITIVAINAGLLDLVKASITGSIIGNLLLVMGASLLLGGLKNGTQHFTRSHVSNNATMLVLAVVALTIPSLLNHTLEGEILPIATLENISLGVAVVMIVLYALGLWFAFKGIKSGGALAHAGGAESEAPAWSVNLSLVVLAGATLATVWLSEVLVGEVEAVTAQFGLSEFFIGIILVPLIGNVAEHLVAVQVAIKNQMDLSLEIALGSSLQIALFVAPVLVFVALLFGEQLTLVFNQFELVALVASVLITSLVASDGETNWLEGAQLVSVYLILGVVFFFIPG